MTEEAYIIPCPLGCGGFLVPGQPHECNGPRAEPDTAEDTPTADTEPPPEEEGDS